MAKRKIIRIDEEKCNGCGLCIPNCPEGALQVIDGKARLISDLFCDGLGACLGHCPQGAITIEEREAQEFDEKKAKEAAAHAHGHFACPSVKVIDLRKKEAVTPQKTKSMPTVSQLNNWPVQIKLVPVNAPYLNGADLLIAADCVAFSYANFHDDLLKGKVLLVGCPKLDDAEFYQKKMTEIFKGNNIKSVTCVHMEVPCCFGLVSLVQSAISASGRKIPYKEVTISIKGEKIA